MTARQRHHLRTRAHQLARREGRPRMAGVVNVMVAPSPLLTAPSRAAAARADARVWQVLDRLWPQGTGMGPNVRADIRADVFESLGIRLVFEVGA